MFPIEQHTIFLTLAGSQAHGTAREGSDVDLRGWLATMHRIGGGWRDAYVFFKHEDKGTGPALGARLTSLTATG